MVIGDDGQLLFQDRGVANRFELATNGALLLGDYVTAGVTPPAKALLVSGNVGIGRTDPLGKLHVKGVVAGENLYIEGTGEEGSGPNPVGRGRLGFLKDGATSGNDGTQMWREGEIDNSVAPDTVILQTRKVDPEPSTLFVIKAPPPGLPKTDREATLALSRDLAAGGAEFMDLYNNGFSTETQYGIRIQKRVAGQYRDFAFDQFNGTTHIYLMILKADGKVTIGNIRPSDTLSGTDRDLRIKFHDNFAGSESIQATAAITTTDASETTLRSIALENGRAYWIVAKVAARQSDGSNRAFYYRAACVFRETVGGSQLLPTVEDLATKESDANWNCTIDVDAGTNTARVRVKGVAGTTIHWVATIEYQSVATNA